jgi:hypothetical protein
MTRNRKEGIFMKRRKAFAALTAIMLCAAGAMSGLTAQASYLLDPEKIDGEESYLASCYVVLDATDPSTDQMLFYNVGISYSAVTKKTLFWAGPTGIWNYATPQEVRPYLFPSTYAPGQKEVEVGDVLAFHGNFSVLGSYPGIIVSEENSPLADEPTYIENLGRYDELLHTEELVLTERTEAGDELESDVSFTFESEEGKTYTFAEQPAFCIDGLEPGATVKAITYLDTAVPMEVLAATPLPAGDPDEDGAVNSKDASAVLRTAAQIGAKNKPSLNLAQRKACDVNGDGVVNANDASDILRYAAYIGAKNPYRSIQDFLAK